MFGFFRRKEAPVEAVSAAGGPVMAALLLNSDSFDFDQAKRAIATAKIGGAAAKDIEVRKNILTFSAAGREYYVSPMPAPYPWSDLEGPCQTSWMWPPETPAMTMKSHKTHVLVIDAAGKDRIGSRLALTQLCSALTAVTSVIGIFWPEATVVHYPPIFKEMAEIATREGPPLYLWVDFRVYKHSENFFGLFTTGMAALGLMDMELAPRRESPAEIRDWAVNIAAYIYERGSPIPHGETIGASAADKHKVTHVRSSFGGPGTVMRIA